MGRHRRIGSCSHLFIHAVSVPAQSQVLCSRSGRGLRQKTRGGLDCWSLMRGHMKTIDGGGVLTRLHGWLFLPSPPGPHLSHVCLLSFSELLEMEKASWSLGRPATALLGGVQSAFQAQVSPSLQSSRGCPYPQKEPQQRPLYVVVRAEPAAWPALALPLQANTGHGYGQASWGGGSG